MWTALVPARGGSKGVRGKNLRSIHGRPLILWTLDLLTQIKGLKVVVTTDSHQIRSTVLSHYPDIEIWDRPAHLATDSATIDDLAYHHYKILDSPLLIVQPTTFGLTKAMVTDLMRYAMEVPGQYFATQPTTGIYWQDGVPVNEFRRNRQDTITTLEKEVGLRAYTEHNVIPQAYPLDHPVTEIDTLGDFIEAEKDGQCVAIVFSAAPGEGWGHLYRALSLYESLQHHRVILGCTTLTTPAARTYVESIIGRSIINSASFATYHGGVWINDTLDTSEAHIGELMAKGWKVISLEDQGAGARLTHATINSLYGDGTYNGVKYAVLRPEFLDLPPYEVRQKADKILVSFGGEDAKGFGLKVARYLQGDTVTYLTPPATADSKVPVAREMQKADLLITSAGRTVYEAMAVGVPTVVLAANLREARHCHLGPDHGNLYMGLAEEVLKDATTLPRTVASLLDSYALRSEMSIRGRQMVDGKGASRIVRIVEDLL